ncbi:antibiotic biosynthesis monooxygenase [Chryseobacterium sp. GMJ5]|uniref:Antibiotic biosynthesis monooxygenase n=1 Tax=Chryseobacterium gilvum TaxID=2976534 RepID=A0ABT2W076_9FLAO|nr:antibiotic biosynthesis monooxygenase family protein [Chryseobacterium gilvum]MCU7615323.1 antibiotic biosynthesis monooxygenase [Chryseobacterium gilvum]
MINLKPLDPNITILQQMKDDNCNEPAVLFNLFSVAEEDIPAVLKAWTADALFLKTQPGYISTQLHQATAGSNLFFNYAVWESVAHFKAAFNHPDFKKSMKDYPDSAVSQPHLFKRLSIPNICVGP